MKQVLEDFIESDATISAPGAMVRSRNIPTQIVDSVKGFGLGGAWRRPFDG